MAGVCFSRQFMRFCHLGWGWLQLSEGLSQARKTYSVQGGIIEAQALVLTKIFN